MNVRKRWERASKLRGKYHYSKIDREKIDLFAKKRHATLKFVSGRKGYEFPSGLRKRQKEELRNRCQCCGKKFAKSQLEIHHQLVYAAEAGDRQFDPAVIKTPFNSATVCHECHLRLHRLDETRTEEQISAGYQRLVQEAEIVSLRLLRQETLYRYLYQHLETR